VLGFVSKAAGALLARRLKNVDSTELAALGCGLSIDVGDKGIAVYGFDKTIAKYGSRRTKFVERESRIDMFLGIGIDRPILNQSLCAGRWIAVCVCDSELIDLKCGQ